MENYDIIIVGAGPGGLYTAYELIKNNTKLKIAIFEAGNNLENRYCPVAAKKSDKCVNCKVCSIMKGFGGAGAYSDGKYNITNDFGGDLHLLTGEEKAIELMNYVDEINVSFQHESSSKLYDNTNSNKKFEELNTECLKKDLHLLSAKVRHLGTDGNYEVLANLEKYLSEYPNISFFYNTTVKSICQIVNSTQNWKIITEDFKEYECKDCVLAVGRSGSDWMEKVCKDLNIKTSSNNVDLGVRVELPYNIFSHLTDNLYETKIVYSTEKYGDKVRTFCMNPKGEVVTENTNGIITVNGHSYEDDSLKTNNTNFALLVNKHFTEPFNESTLYGQSIAKLSNMLGGGVIVQRFGDLIRGRRTTESRLKDGFVKPTLNATPGDLSLVLPKRILDDIIEMIYALDKIAPGTANDDTLLYGVEVKFYNMQVLVDANLEALQNLYIIGDGSGITHSLSHASASGVYVARKILERESY